jgi:hypothetical protein
LINKRTPGHNIRHDDQQNVSRNERDGSFYGMTWIFQKKKQC